MLALAALASCGSAPPSTESGSDLARRLIRSAKAVEPPLAEYVPVHGPLTQSAAMNRELAKLRSADTVCDTRLELFRISDMSEQAWQLYKDGSLPIEDAAVIIGETRGKHGWYVEAQDGSAVQIAEFRGRFPSEWIRIAHQYARGSADVPDVPQIELRRILHTARICE